MTFCKAKGIDTDDTSGLDHDTGASENNVVLFPRTVPGQEIRYRDQAQAICLLNPTDPPSREVILKRFEETLHLELKVKWGREPTEEESIRVMHQVSDASAVAAR